MRAANNSMWTVIVFIIFYFLFFFCILTSKYKYTHIPHHLRLTGLYPYAMSRILSSIWHNIYTFVSTWIYPTVRMHSAGQRQLLGLAYPEPITTTNPITHKNNTYYITAGGIQILTWNIHHGLDCIMRPRLLEIAKYLSVAHAHADIICLQEVNTSFMFIPGHGLVNQATYLAAYLGYYCYYHNNLAILSKAPIIQELEPIQTKQHASKFTGHIIGCTICINSQSIKIYNCHLPNDISGVSQLHGINNKYNGLFARVLDDTYNNRPVIITGDFNCNELFGAIQTLKKITTVASTRHPSYPIIVPLIQLDYILTNGEWVGGLKIKSSAADYKCHLSDHYPINALISFPPTNSIS